MTLTFINAAGDPEELTSEAPQLARDVAGVVLTFGPDRELGDTLYQISMTAEEARNWRAKSSTSFH